MRHENLRALVETGQVQPVEFSRAELLAIVIAKYRSKECASTHYAAVKDLDHKCPEDLQKIATVDTGMQPAIDALNEAGYPTDATARGLLDALSLAPRELHAIYCFCDHAVLWGNMIANQLAKV